MIVVFGGIKGGGGKTTLATNLAVLRAKSGHKVLLVDADEQNSASNWAEQREGMGFETTWSTIRLGGKSVNLQLQKMGADYDDVLIDVGGRDTTSQRSALTIADVFIMPFKPSGVDMWTIGQADMMIDEIRAVNPSLVCITLVNQADSLGDDNDEAADILRDWSNVQYFPGMIGYRKAFRHAATKGLSVVELESPNKKANDEIKLLYEHVFQTCLMCQRDAE